MVHSIAESEIISGEIAKLLKEESLKNVTWKRVILFLLPLLEIKMEACTLL